MKTKDILAKALHHNILLGIAASYFAYRLQPEIGLSNLFPLMFAFFWRAHTELIDWKGRESGLFEDQIKEYYENSKKPGFLRLRAILMEEYRKKMGYQAIQPSIVYEKDKAERIVDIYMLIAMAICVCIVIWNIYDLVN